MEDTLYNRLYDEKDLTDAEIEELVQIVGSGCRQETKARLYRRLSMPSLMPRHDIYRRVDLDPVGYCAGQSYPDEIRTVRQLILKG